MRDRERIADGVARREFLRRAGATGLALTSGGLLLGACGSEGTSAEGAAGTAGTTSAATTGEVTTVGFDHPLSSVPFVSDVQRYMQRFADERGDRLLLTSDNGKLDAQVANLETWIAQRVPAIICFPLEPATVEKLAASARERGICWISYATDIENQDGSVLFENRKGGEALAAHACDFVERVHGGKAKILQLTFPDGGQLGRDRDEAIRTTLEQRLPDSEIVADQRGVVTQEGLQATQATLAAHPDLAVVIGMSDDGTLGAFQAFKEAGRDSDDPKLWVGGMDGSRGALENIKAGTFYRASAALLVAELAEACLEHPLAVANGTAKGTRIVPVKLLAEADGRQIDEHLSQLSKA